MSFNNQTIDALDVLLRSQAARTFQVQMIVQNASIAQAQPQKLRQQLGLEALPLEEQNYYLKTAAQFLVNSKTRHPPWHASVTT